MTRTVHRLRVGIEDQLAASRHGSALLEVPFEVGTHQDSVEVTLAYDREAAVIDLGCDGAAGWRGWSGGARDRFVIRRDAATPGYLPGELESGDWKVILGLYQVPVEPLDVTVTIEMPASSEVPPEPIAATSTTTVRASERRLPAPRGLTWFAGDFHSHTTHSDGEQSPSELAALAADNGLDFLAVTDHNTTSHHACLPRVGATHGITLLPGQEVTTARGHANAFGDIGWVDFREHPDRWVTDVAARGGLLSVNHPLQDEWAWQHPLATLPPALELWHITWFLKPTATAPWALLARWRSDAILLGGSDYHHPRHQYPPGTPVTWVAATDRSPEALLDAARAGRTAITRQPTPDTPALVRVDGDLIADAAEGTVLSDTEGRRRLILGERLVVPAHDAGLGPFRLETPDGAILAISP